MKNKKNAFTLVELLSVIVILAIILVIAVPKVMSIINDVKEGSLESTAKLIASSAEKLKTQNDVLGINKEITCESIAKLNNIDYERCYISFDGNKAQVDIKGSGKFEGMHICKGTKDNADVVERCPNEKVFVTISLNGGSFIENGEIITEDIIKTYKEGTIIDIKTPTKENSTFLGWNVVKGDSTFDENTNKLTIGENDTILHARWQANPLITIDYDNGEENLSERHVTNTTLDLGIPEKENYKFIRWEKVSGDALLSGNSLTIGTEDTVIKAIWELNTFNLSIDLVGGNVLESQEGTYKVGDTIDLVSPTKEGYTFSNWELISGIESGILSGNTFTMGTKDAEVKAIYIINTYQINYELDGGTLGYNSPISGEYDSIVQLVNPNKVAYIFTGWTVSEGAILSENQLTMGDGDVTLTALWEKADPVVSYSCSNKTVGSEPYLFTYSSDCDVIDDGNGNWRMKFLKSGTFTTTTEMIIDIFLVGGGGNGGNGGIHGGGGGGGGGKTETILRRMLTANIEHEIVVGSAGANTTAFGISVSGGTNGSAGGTGTVVGTGGSGSSTGGKGAICCATGGSGGNGVIEFNESTGTYYGGAGGGGGGQLSESWSSGGAGGSGGGGKGGGPKSSGSKGSDNTGGGGGGGGAQYGGGTGGSGVVVIRNNREEISVEDNKVPTFTYTGRYVVLNDNEEMIGASLNNWKIKFLSSGTLIINDLKGAVDGVDIFLVGGGGNGGAGGIHGGGGGGGGGKTETALGTMLTEHTKYEIVVGDAAANTTAFGITASGGTNGSAGGTGTVVGTGGSGSSTGGKGAICCDTGGSGGNGVIEFNESTGIYYGGAGGGGGGQLSESWSSGGAGGSGGGGKGGGPKSSGSKGSDNTGGGGGGGGAQYSGGAGGTGVVIVRNKR